MPLHKVCRKFCQSHFGKIHTHSLHSFQFPDDQTDQVDSSHLHCNINCLMSEQLEVCCQRWKNCWTYKPRCDIIVCVACFAQNTSCWFWRPVLSCDSEISLEEMQITSTFLAWCLLNREQSGQVNNTDFCHLQKESATTLFHCMLLQDKPIGEIHPSCSASLSHFMLAQCSVIPLRSSLNDCQDSSAKNSVLSKLERKQWMSYFTTCWTFEDLTNWTAPLSFLVQFCQMQQIFCAFLSMKDIFALFHCFLLKINTKQKQFIFGHLFLTNEQENKRFGHKDQGVCCHHLPCTQQRGGIFSLGWPFLQGDWHIQLGVPHFKSFL